MPAPPLAEVKIIAGDNPANLETADENLADEILGRHGGERGVEGKDDHPGNTGARQRNRLGLLRGEPKNRIRLEEKIGRMRLEGEHGARPPEPARDRLGAFEHRDMAAVDAIEIADRDDRALKARGGASGSTTTRKLGEEGTAEKSDMKTRKEGAGRRTGATLPRAAAHVKHRRHVAATRAKIVLLFLTGLCAS